MTPATPSSDYTILNTDAVGDPITYDPCKPVHYVINPSGAPTNYLEFIEPAVARAQAATGLEFVYDGVSSDTWSRHLHAKAAEPVLLSFPEALDSSAADADAVGLGGSTFTALNGLRQPHYLTGQIALLSNWFRNASAHHETAAEQSVVMHELGHVIGLGHVGDPHQVMFPSDHGQTDYGAGDLAGLARLGAGACD